MADVATFIRDSVISVTSWYDVTEMTQQRMNVALNVPFDVGLVKKNNTKPNGKMISMLPGMFSTTTTTTAAATTTTTTATTTTTRNVPFDIRLVKKK